MRDIIGDPSHMTDPGRVAVAFTRKQWAIAALLFLMIVLNYLDRVVLSLVSPVMRQDLGLSTRDYATAVNAFLIAYGIMYLGSGVIIRLGARTGLALFVGSWSIVSGCHALTVGLASLAAFRFMLADDHVNDAFRVFVPGRLVHAVEGRVVLERHALPRKFRAIVEQRDTHVHVAVAANHCHSGPEARRGNCSCSRRRTRLSASRRRRPIENT